MTRGTLLELRSAALVANARKARQLAGSARLFAMVKANAYGHGLPWAATVMAPEVDGFGVALMAEARTLREAGITAPLLLVEGCFDPQELLEASTADIHSVVHSAWQIEQLESTRLPAPITVWLKVDSGMHRLGMPVGEAAAAIKRLGALPGVSLAGVMSHFACADMPRDARSGQQLSALRALADSHGLPFSLANSAGLYRYPESHGALVRPGIMLYGGSPFPGQPAASLGLAVTQRLSARLIAINDVSAGEAVGYGAAWSAPRPSRIGVVAMGYGDGYPRQAPSGTPVAVNGVRASLVGRVSMDMLTVDLTDLPAARVGDSVELWGDVVSADEVAAACGTISYELFCQVTQRVKRVLA